MTKALEWDRRILASRRLLAECRAWPDPDNQARAETEHGLLLSLALEVPQEKERKVRALAQLYRRFLHECGVKTRGQ